MRYAVLASLLLHVLLLWPEPLPPPAREARALLQATVRSPQPVHVPEQPRASVQRSLATRSEPVPVPTAATPLPAILPLESPRPVSVQSSAVTVAEADAKPAVPAAAEIAAPAAGARPGGVAVGSSLASAGSGESLDGLRGYRLAVASQARRFKRYPADAKASGWTGSTEVRLEVGAEGQPRPATVSRSSGHEALDRAALAMIDAGAQRARLPDSLRGRGFAVLLPVLFSLDEE